MSRFDDLNDAIAYRDLLISYQESGQEAGTVSHGGRTVVYHNILELDRLVQRAQDHVKRLQELAAGNTSRAGFSLVRF